MWLQATPVRCRTRSLSYDLGEVTQCLCNPILHRLDTTSAFPSRYGKRHIVSTHIVSNAQALGIDGTKAGRHAGHVTRAQEPPLGPQKDGILHEIRHRFALLHQHGQSKEMAIDALALTCIPRVRRVRDGCLFNPLSFLFRRTLFVVQRLHHGDHARRQCPRRFGPTVQELTRTGRLVRAHERVAQHTVGCHLQSGLGQGVGRQALLLDPVLAKVGGNVECIQVHGLNALGHIVGCRIHVLDQLLLYRLWESLPFVLKQSPPLGWGSFQQCLLYTLRLLHLLQ